MRRSLVAALVGGVCWCHVGLVGAGVYNTEEEPFIQPDATADGVKPLPFSHFRDVLSDLMRIGVEQPDNLVRQRYLKRRDELRAKARIGDLTESEWVNLSESLIRLGQYEEAVEVLTPVTARHRGNFMLLANLGAANQHAGHLDRAIVVYLYQVKVVWPKEWPGLSKEQLEWYRRAETYHWKLLQLRNREAQEARGRPKPPDTVDALFEKERGKPVRFVGDSGQYEAGQLAAAERDKLPPDALAIVQQLLIWLPGDTRLYWLYGELLNAQGDIAAAETVLEECVWSRGFNVPQLREHRQILQEARAKVAPPTATSWLPGRRQLLVVGGVAGLLIAVLGYLQIREMFRRKTNVNHR